MPAPSQCSIAIARRFFRSRYSLQQLVNCPILRSSSQSKRQFVYSSMVPQIWYWNGWPWWSSCSYVKMDVVVPTAAVPWLGAMSPRSIETRERFVTWCLWPIAPRIWCRGSSIEPTRSALICVARQSRGKNPRPLNIP